MAEKKNKGVPLFRRIKEEEDKKAKRREIEKVQVEFDRAVKNGRNFLKYLLKNKKFNYFHFYFTNVDMQKKKCYYFLEEFFIQNKRKVVSSQIMNRSVEENWNKIKNFYAKKNELITQAQFEKLEKEVEGLTFKPTINEKTNKLMVKFKNKIDSLICF